jgi:hypothetical protein
MTTILHHLSGAEQTLGKIFPQPAAANITVPPRSKWGGRKRNYLCCPFRRQMRTRADFYKGHVGKRGAWIQRPLISGSQVQALVGPPSSPPKPAVEDLPAGRPISAGFSRSRGRLLCLCVQASSLSHVLGRRSPAAKIPFPAAAWTQRWDVWLMPTPALTGPRELVRSHVPCVLAKAFGYHRSICVPH